MVLKRFISTTNIVKLHTVSKANLCNFFIYIILSQNYNNYNINNNNNLTTYISVFYNTLCKYLSTNALYVHIHTYKY